MAVRRGCIHRIPIRHFFVIVASVCGSVSCTQRQDARREPPTEQEVFARLIELGALPEFVSSERVILRSEWKGGDDGLAELKYLPKLRELKIYENNVTNAGIKHIAAVTQLERLRLRRLNIDNDGIAALTTLQNLRALEIPALQIDDGAIPHIVKLKRLEILWLSGNRITDQRIASLQALRSLLELRLSATHITDLSIPSLSKLSSLQYLSVRETKVSDDAIKRLWESLPNVRVVGAAGGFPAAQGEKLGTPGTP